MKTITLVMATLLLYTFVAPLATAEITEVEEELKTQVVMTKCVRVKVNAHDPVDVYDCPTTLRNLW